MMTSLFLETAQNSQRPLIFQIFTELPFETLLNLAVTFRVFTPLLILNPNSPSFRLLCSPSTSPSHSPRAKITARGTEMAPKKNKSKLDVEEVADLSTGW